MTELVVDRLQYFPLPSQYTFFRYPGGKSKMAPALLSLMGHTFSESPVFLDLFAGGGSVSILAALAHPKKHFIMNDFDFWVSSFWDVIRKKDLCGDLVHLLNTHAADIETFSRVRKESENASKSPVKNAFYAVFFNRTCFSGVLYATPIGGWSQKDKSGKEKKWGVSCRYNPGRLSKKIYLLHELFKNRLDVLNDDAISLLKNFKNEKSCIYLDPPYYKSGHRLYKAKFGKDKHEQMRDEISALNGNLNIYISYDDCEKIRELYGKISIFHPIETKYFMNQGRIDHDTKEKIGSHAKEVLVEIKK